MDPQSSLKFKTLRMKDIKIDIKNFFNNESSNESETNTDSQNSTVSLVYMPKILPINDKINVQEACQDKSIKLESDKCITDHIYNNYKKLHTIDNN